MSRAGEHGQEVNREVSRKAPARDVSNAHFFLCSKIQTCLLVFLWSRVGTDLEVNTTSKGQLSFS